MAIRYLEKFENAAASISYVFPLGMYEWQSQGGMRVPLVPAIGMDYAFDMLGIAQAIMEPVQETVRGVLRESSLANAEAEIDEMRSELIRAGRGKLFTLSSDGSRRWAWARLAAMPEISISHRLGHIGSGHPFILQFTRLSEWFGSSLTSDTETITTSPTTYTVNNSGNLPARLLKIRLRANTSAGITNPKVTNMTNGYVFETARDSSSVDSEIRLDTERGVVEFSTDNGANYTDDFAQLVIPTTQVVLAFQLEPGDNSIKYEGGGTVNVDVVFEFYPHWA